MKRPNETTLIIVEDEFLVALGLEATLQSAGYTVLEPISTVAEALEAVYVRPADLALLDVNLAGHQVFPVADALLSQRVPFIFLSGCDESLPARFLGIPVLLKPISPEKLLRVISHTLDGVLAHGS
ncbi:MAG: response regulator [Alphaproteobacteria bacterium]|nr:response regulator [Alphaproteobacteria bacterium]